MQELSLIELERAQMSVNESKCQYRCSSFHWCWECSYIISNLFAPYHCYLHNYYATPSRLFIIGGREILSSEGTTQGDPTAVGAFALGILPLNSSFEFINLNKMNAKEVAFADNFYVVCSLNSIKDYCNKLTAIGPKYGYFPKPRKSYLIVKEKKWWKHKIYLQIQDSISQLKENNTSVQLSEVKNIVMNMWKI